MNLRRIQQAGIALIAFSLAVLVALPFLSTYTLDEQIAIDQFDNAQHHPALRNALAGLSDQDFGNPFAFVKSYRTALAQAQVSIREQVTAEGLTPSDNGYWTAVLQDWQIRQSIFPVVKAASHDVVLARPLLFFLV
ncbi:MAG: hypothetical protein R3330_09560, partial [Saprospiraceae bacterium]|nr:hypothetical protein [Saprospiraceae bacterium]